MLKLKFLVVLASFLVLAQPLQAGDQTNNCCQRCFYELLGFLSGVSNRSGYTSQDEFIKEALAQGYRDKKLKKLVDSGRRPGSAGRLETPINIDDTDSDTAADAAGRPKVD